MQYAFRCNSSNMICASFASNLYPWISQMESPGSRVSVTVRVPYIQTFCLQKGLQNDYPDTISHNSAMPRFLSFSVFKGNMCMYVCMSTGFFPQCFLFVCFSLWVGWWDVKLDFITMQFTHFTPENLQGMFYNILHSRVLALV